MSEQLSPPRLHFYLTLAIFGSLVSCPSWPKSPEDIFMMAAPSVVIVESHDSSGSLKTTGSGVVISLGEVVTNCHVVNSGRIFSVKQGESVYSAEIRHADIARDLCQLSVLGLKAPPAIMGAVTSLKPGVPVVAIGAPRGLELSISEGIVSSLRKQADGSILIQTTAPISPGSSGGGLFNEEGLLVGITTLYISDSQNLNFAIPVSWISGLNMKNDNADLLNSFSSHAHEHEEAIAALAILGESLRASDPNFNAKIKYFRGIIESLISSNTPVSEWPANFEKAYWLLPDAEASTDRFSERAIALTYSKDWQGLLEHTQSWTKSEPQNKLAWYSLGRAHQELGGQFNESAGVYYQRALDSYETNAKEMLLNMGNAETSQFENENLHAIKAFTEAIKLDPEFAEAWYQFGLSSLQTKDQNSAVTAYQVLQKIDPKLAETLLNAFRQ